MHLNQIDYKNVQNKYIELRQHQIKESKHRQKVVRAHSQLNSSLRSTEHDQEQYLLNLQNTDYMERHCLQQENDKFLRSLQGIMK